MNISLKSNRETFEYSMGNHKLSKSDCEKDIGVYIDNNLKFETHINNAVNKANRVLAITRRTFECMDDEVFSMIFKGLVRPHLEYAAPVWSPHLIKNKELLENVQRRATKLVPGLKGLSYPDRLRKLKLPTLAYRRARGDMIQMYKILTDNKDSYDKTLPIMFEYSNTGLRGHGKKVFLPRVNKDIRKYNFNIRVINIWNDLPEKVVLSSSIENFEKNLDEYWQSQELKFDNFLAEIRLSSRSS